MKLSDVDAKTGKPITEGNVPFFALDTLLQFARFEQVPEEVKETVRQKFFWALMHDDLGICTLGEPPYLCYCVVSNSHAWSLLPLSRSAELYRFRMSRCMGARVHEQAFLSAEKEVTRTAEAPRSCACNDGSGSLEEDW